MYKTFRGYKSIQHKIYVYLRSTDISDCPTQMTTTEATSREITTDTSTSAVTRSTSYYTTDSNTTYIPDSNTTSATNLLPKISTSLEINPPTTAGYTASTKEGLTTPNGTAIQGSNILIVGVSAGVPALAVLLILSTLTAVGIIIFKRRRKVKNLERDFVPMEDNAAYVTTGISTDANECYSSFKTDSTKTTDDDAYVLNPNINTTDFKTTVNESYGTNTCPMTDNQAYRVKGVTNTSRHDHTDTAEQMYATISEERVCVCQEQDYDYVPCTNATS